ncbi:AAA family ATPase [Aquabacter sp. L1I39]|uniref:AAA family ATPase n=1 Tax=Aquabacter sp. L1I39 TaxID=2820278 RepID=UPI001AD99F1B|nr:ATP-binding protein [Aquabacter sp. L1I39]QTL02237.1 AAA family ATPase [Aquabacter sp. L1I39]
MKLTALRLHNVRRFANTGVRIEGIGDGVNVLCAANEQGKSTCFDALHALFFQTHTSASSTVQALRPHSGGGPLVEADIVTRTGAFRLSKQFLAGKRAQVHERDSGRLLAQADEAERFIAGLIHDGAGGPAGLLWVRQGTTGLERRVKSEEETERRARETVLTSVQGEVETLTGGRRMTLALAACDTELSRLVTASTGRPKANSPYDGALKTRDRLAEQERHQAAEVADLRDALDRRRALRARLAEIDSPDLVREREEAVTLAAAALAEAQARADALRAARMEAEAAESRRQGALGALARFRDTLTRHAQVSREAAQAADLRDQARERQRQAVEDANHGAARLAAAEAQERTQRDLLAALERAAAAQAARQALASAHAALRQAESARAELEGAEAALKSVALPAGQLAELEKLETLLVGLRAAATARAPLLRMDYLATADGAVRIGGVSLGQHEERPLVGSTRIEIEGVGTLTVSFPPLAESAEENRKAEARRRALLAELGVEDLTAARCREAKCRELEADVKLARQRLALLAPQGFAALREQIAQLESKAHGASELTDDPERVRARLLILETEVRKGREEARAAQARQDVAGEAVVEAVRRAATLSSSLESLSESLGPEAERVLREDRLAAEVTAANQALEAANTRIADLSRDAPDVAALEARHTRLRSVAAAARDEINRTREQAAALDGRIQTRSEGAVEEALEETREQLAGAERKVAAFAREVAVLTRLRTALEEARTTARDHYFAPLLRELRPLLGLLFDDATVIFDENTLLPRSMRREGFDEKVDVLSGGMREQLAILTRLAFARLLSHGGEAVPVILDDALVYSDDARIERMFDALHDQANNQQVIVFTCRQRAFAKLGGTLLRMEPWQPVA